jgi:hypothetical protein
MQRLTDVLAPLTLPLAVRCLVHWVDRDHAATQTHQHPHHNTQMSTALTHSVRIVTQRHCCTCGSEVWKRWHPLPALTRAQVFSFAHHRPLANETRSARRSSWDTATGPHASAARTRARRPQSPSSPSSPPWPAAASHYNPALETAQWRTLHGVTLKASLRGAGTRERYTFLGCHLQRHQLDTFGGSRRSSTKVGATFFQQRSACMSDTHRMTCVHVRHPSHDLRACQTPIA